MRGQTTAVLLGMLFLGCVPMPGDDDGGYEFLGDAATSTDAGYPSNDLTDAGDASVAVTDGGIPFDGGTPSDGGVDVRLPACTRYVAKSGAVNGLSASTTIQGGLDNLVPGDTLCIGPGRYHEAVSVTKSGTAARPITIRALDPANKPVIDGEYTLPLGPAQNINKPFYSSTTCAEFWEDPNANLGPAPKQACFVWAYLLKISGSYIVWDGIDLSRSRGLGLLIGKYGPPAPFPQSVAFRRSEISHIRNQGVYIAGVTNVSFRANRVHDTNDFAAYSRSAPTTVWSGGTVTWTGGGPGWSGGVYQRYTEDVELIDNVIFHNWGEGVGTGLFGQVTQRTRIKDNRIYDNMSGQLYLTNGSRVVAEKNIVYHTGDPEIWLNKPGYTSCLTLASEDGQSMEDLLIKNNVFAGCASLVVINQYLTTSRLGDVRIHNNTLFGPGGIGLRSGASNLVLDGLSFINNLVFASGISQLPLTVTGIQAHHNIWATPPSDIRLRGPGDIVTSSPGLFNPNYHPTAGAFNVGAIKLTASSVAINAGATLNEVTDDFSGAPRPAGGAYDIGVFEFR